MGDLDLDQTTLIEQALHKFPSLKSDLREIELVLEELAQANEVAPNPTIGPMLMAMIDYEERLKKGERQEVPPLLSPGSKTTDFQKWLQRPDFQEPESYGDIYAKIIGVDDERTTLMVWLKSGAPNEVHSDELESFLILEGSCNIVVEDVVHSLEAGDYFTIPLLADHRVEVTSASACRIILERKAA